MGREIPLTEIRPFIIDVGNNGELSQSGDYRTTEQDLKRLFSEKIPGVAERRHWNKKRIMLYLHGGLNTERDAAKRAVAFHDTFLANGIYPLHFMWETGLLETIADLIGDLFTQADERAGGELLAELGEGRDFALERLASPLGGPMWSEMKENAWRASNHNNGTGAIQLIKKYAAKSMSLMAGIERGKWELHVIAHSAGSILFTYAVEALCSLDIHFKTLQLFAPAVRIDEFEKNTLPAISSGRCPKATIYILNEQQELDDRVGPYGKSLLWLVSNAFEDKGGTPLLGMAQHISSNPELRTSAFNEIIESTGKVSRNTKCMSETHGGFDNDPATMNSVLTRILGKKPGHPFTPDKLDY